MIGECLAKHEGFQCVTREDLLAAVNRYGDIASQIAEQVAKGVETYEEFSELRRPYLILMRRALLEYERPYDPQQPVICLDEKPITLHADVRPASPAVPGREARRDNEYERRGMANVFCAGSLRERVVPTISASVSSLICSMAVWGTPYFPKFANRRSTLARRFSLELKSWSTRSSSIRMLRFKTLEEQLAEGGLLVSTRTSAERRRTRASRRKPHNEFVNPPAWWQR